MVNDPPKSPLHIQLLVEDSEERLTEDQVKAVLDVVRQWLIPGGTMVASDQHPVPIDGED